MIYTNFADAFGFTMALVFFLFIAFLPLFIQRKLHQKFVFIDGINSKETTPEFKEFLAMEERKFDKEWQCFYEDLRTDSRLTMMYNYFFILRRFFFSLSLFYMYDYAALQIIVFVLSSEFYVIYFVYCRPFVDN